MFFFLIGSMPCSEEDKRFSFSSRLCWKKQMYKIKNTMSTKNAEDVTNPCTSFNGLNEWDKYIWLLICTINWICMFMETQIANWNNDFLIFKVHYRWHQSYLNMSDGLMLISVQLKDEDFSAYQGWIVLYCAIYALTLLSLHFELYFLIVMLYLTVLIPLRSVFCLWRVTGQCKCQFTSEIKHIFHI